MQYLPADTQPLQVLENSSQAYISRYALGRDYHKVLRRRLAKLAEQINITLASSAPPFSFRAFTDSAPVLEKALGEKSGLGWIGKHTLLLDKEAGSWFSWRNLYQRAAANRRCRDRGQLRKMQRLHDSVPDRSHRIAEAPRCPTLYFYLTIENRSSIPVEFRKAIGNRIYGCDDCQLFCPWNRESPTTTEADFAVRHGLDNPSLIDLFQLTESEFLALTGGLLCVESATHSGNVT